MIDLRTNGLATAMGCSILGLILFAQAASAEVIVYPEYAGAPKSSYCTMTVDDQPVFVFEHKEKAYAHFAFSGEVTVTITSPTAIGTFDIQPKPYNIQATKNGNSISFKLNQPRKLVISLAGPYRFGSPALFVFAEGPEVNPPKLGDPNVKNIMDYGVDNTGGTEATGKINQAITEVSALPNGGVVYIPKGKYKSSTVVMKSRVTLYLEGGAYILAAGATQSTSIKTQSNWSGVCMIGFNQCTDAHVTGRGTFDWNGGQWGYEMGQCRRCSIEGMILKNNNRWTVHPVNCDSIQLINIKILNHSLTSGGYSDDPINVDVCRDVLIDDCFAFAVDDFTTSCGTPGTPLAAIENYTIRNCVACNSFRFHLVKGGGEGNYTYIKNLVIENCHQVVNPGEGGPIFCLVDGTTAGGRAMYLEGLRIRNSSTSGSLGLVATANAGYTLRDWSVENFQQLTPLISQFGNTGVLQATGGTIQNVTFKCYTIGTRTLLSAADCAAAKFTLTAATVTFLPCDASGIAPISSSAFTPAAGFISSNDQQITIGYPGSYRLLVMRPDGRLIAQRQGAGEKTYDIRQMTQGAPGTYLLHLLTNGTSVSRIVTEY